MKKVLAIVLAVSLLLGMTAAVNAAEAYEIVLGEGMTVYVNGVAITADTSVTDADKIKIEAEGAAVIEADGVYYPVDEEFLLSGGLDLSEAVALALGLEMVDGAQVRVSAEDLSEDGRLTNEADSGLRFLATRNRVDTVVDDENVEFGIKVTAEGNDNPVYVKAEKFQDADETVFTAAITHLVPSNYNRKYTAEAYALVPMHDGTVKEFTEGSVTRSIYQVSVGILKNSSADFENNLPYTVDEAVKSVLSAYVNQNGIRLTYTEVGKMSARLSGKGAYTGDLYFNVTSSLNADGATAVTITPLGESDGFFNSVAIPSWWQDYIRINNNNSVAKDYISDAKLEGGILSFNFKIPEEISYEFNQEDNVTVVSEIGTGYIKGFKAGVEVNYTLASSVDVMGLAKTMEDVVPGSVIMVGTTEDGEVAAVELLASIGMPVDPEVFSQSFGVYAASDGSTKYKNVVTQMFSKLGKKVTTQNLPDETKTTYEFESNKSPCYRVGIAMNGDTPVVTLTSGMINRGTSVFLDTSKHQTYLYLRYNSETEEVKECVLYCVPKDLDLSGDGEYSGIFSLEDYRIILE